MTYEYRYIDDVSESGSRLTFTEVKNLNIHNVWY